MKWIKTRQSFLNEAKIRDVIFPRQAKVVKSVWGEQFLEYEEITPTDKIKQGKWKLSEEDKMKALGAFFDCDMKEVYKIFSSLNDKFAATIAQSINTDLYSKESYKVIMKDFNIINPTIDQIVIIYDPVFRKIAVSETMATEIIQKDESGRPIRDESGNMIRTTKKKGDLVFSNNLVNIFTFVEDFNRCFDSDAFSQNFDNYNIANLRNLARTEENRDYKVDFEIFNKDLYLSISHNPKDILNMSISKFYASCQHLYGGGYRDMLLGNVFDPNSIPAFLTFETPIFWDDEKISDQLPLSRLMIRNIETFDSTEESKIFFDRAYPDRMREVFCEIIEQYSENKSNIQDGDRGSYRYIFTPDINPEDSIREPYMDRLGIERRPYIGINTKSLYLNRNHDWSKVKIAPNAKIKELVIETTEIPDDLLKMNLNPDWVKFKFLTINTFTSFDKIKTDSLAFDKCKFNVNIFNEINTTNPDLKKLQIVSCDLTGKLDFSMFKSLEELQIVYTLNSVDELKDAIQGLKIKKLVISGDLFSDKQYINELKRKIKVEIIGPKI